MIVTAYLVFLIDTDTRMMMMMMMMMTMVMRVESLDFVSSAAACD
jgi:hypothetical protein